MKGVLENTHTHTHTEHRLKMQGKATCKLFGNVVQIVEYYKDDWHHVAKMTFIFTLDVGR